MPAKVLHGDCLAILPTLETNSIDAIVCDPPYCLDSIRKRFGSQTAKPTSARQHRGIARGFMGCSWDDDIAFKSDVWRECLRLLKPGGHLAAFGSSRTHHRLWCAIEDAGFEIRDTLMWLFGQGFPKSMDIAKSVQSLQRKGNARFDNSDGDAFDQIAAHDLPGSMWKDCASGKWTGQQADVSDVEALAWQGWGTALKPSHEPILLARKPLIGTVAENVLAHGTGALNIDASRVGTESTKRISNAGTNGDGWGMGTHAHLNGSDAGRWPPNLLLSNDEEVLECFPHTKSGDLKPYQGAPRTKNTYEGGWPSYRDVNQKGDEGSAARFFPSLPFTDDERRVLYCPKASKRDRAGSKHPTIKPIKLMEWLCKLITPPGGTILDPFAGSGSTGQAASNLGFNSILIEQDDTYVKDIERRLAMFIA